MREICISPFYLDIVYLPTSDEYYRISSFQGGSLLHPARSNMWSQIGSTREECQGAETLHWPGVSRLLSSSFNGIISCGRFDNAVCSQIAQRPLAGW
jgi:hypothetical protein